MNFDLVLVKWIDAHAVTEGWTHIPDLDPLEKLVESIGFVLPEVKKGHVVLAQSMIRDEETVDHVLAIPEAMIRHVVKLRVE